MCYAQACAIRRNVVWSPSAQLAASKGCDGVDPDNVDAYQLDNPPFGITRADELAYVKWIAKTVHK